MKNSAWLIGRADANYAHIQLDNDTISKNHATLSYYNGRFYLVDNSSTNGTFLKYRDKSIYLNQHYEVRPKDEIYLGDASYFLYELIKKTQGVDGVDITRLIILDNKYMDREVDNRVEKRPPPKPSIPKPKSGKRIRCLDCTTPIFSNSTCPKCGSKRHFEEIDW
jgi:hypothetical protein